MLPGDKQTIALTHSSVIGSKNVRRAKLTVTTLRKGKKQKIDHQVLSDQALAVLIQLARSDSRDGDLYRAIAGFIAASPSS